MAGEFYIIYRNKRAGTESFVQVVDVSAKTRNLKRVFKGARCANRILSLNTKANKRSPFPRETHGSHNVTDKTAAFMTRTRHKRASFLDVESEELSWRLALELNLCIAAG